MLDLSEVEFSSWDKRNAINIPTNLTPELAEECGLHIGDGCLISTRNLYMYSLRGHAQDDAKFYKNFIPKLYQTLFNLNPKIRLWPDVIGFQSFSRAVGTFKTKVLNMPLGNKNNISIPEMFLEKNLDVHVLRGLFDTDGCIDFERKSRDKPYYPRITITTTSKILSNQIAEILSDSLGFNISVWKSDLKNINWKRAYRVCTRGKNNFNRWFEISGSHNPKYVYKYNYWKRYGHAPVAQ